MHEVRVGFLVRIAICFLSQYETNTIMDVMYGNAERDRFGFESKTQSVRKWTTWSSSARKVRRDDLRMRRTRS